MPPLLKTALVTGAARGIGLAIASRLAADGMRVALLDVDPAVARGRDGIRTDRVESKGLDYQKRVRAGFLRLAKRDRRRIRVFDASRPSDAVFEDVRKAVDRVL